METDHDVLMDTVKGVKDVVKNVWASFRKAQGQTLRHARMPMDMYHFLDSPDLSMTENHGLKEWPEELLRISGDIKHFMKTYGRKIVQDGLKYFQELPSLELTNFAPVPRNARVLFRACMIMADSNTAHEILPNMKDFTQMLEDKFAPLRGSNWAKTIVYLDSWFAAKNNRDIQNGRIRWKDQILDAKDWLLRSIMPGLPPFELSRQPAIGWVSTSTDPVKSAPVIDERFRAPVHRPTVVEEYVSGERDSTPGASAFGQKVDWKNMSSENNETRFTNFVDLAQGANSNTGDNNITRSNPGSASLPDPSVPSQFNRPPDPVPSRPTKRFSQVIPSKLPPQDPESDFGDESSKSSAIMDTDVTDEFSITDMTSDASEGVTSEDEGRGYDDTSDASALSRETYKTGETFIPETPARINTYRPIRPDVPLKGIIDTADESERDVCGMKIGKPDTPKKRVSWADETSLGKRNVHRPSYRITDDDAGSEGDEDYIPEMETTDSGVSEMMKTSKKVGTDEDDDLPPDSNNEKTSSEVEWESVWGGSAANDSSDDGKMRTGDAAEEFKTPEKDPEEIETLKKVDEEIETPQKVNEEIETPEKAAEEIETPQKAAEEIETPEKAAEKIETPQKAAEEIETPEKAAEEIITPEKAAKEIETPKKAAEEIETPKKPVEETGTAQKPASESETPKKVEYLSDSDALPVVEMENEMDPPEIQEEAEPLPLMDVALNEELPPLPEAPEPSLEEEPTVQTESKSTSMPPKTPLKLALKRKSTAPDPETPEAPPKQKRKTATAKTPAKTPAKRKSTAPPKTPAKDTAKRKSTVEPKTPAKRQRKSTVPPKTPAKTTTKTPAKTPAKAKTPSKTPGKQKSIAKAKTPMKTPAKGKSTKTPSKTPKKTPAKRKSKAGASKDGDEEKIAVSSSKKAKDKKGGKLRPAKLFLNTSLTPMKKAVDTSAPASSPRMGMMKARGAVLPSPRIGLMKGRDGNPKTSVITPRTRAASPRFKSASATWAAVGTPFDKLVLQVMAIVEPHFDYDLQAKKSFDTNLRAAFTVAAGGDIDTLVATGVALGPISISEEEEDLLRNALRELALEAARSAPPPLTSRKPFGTAKPSSAAKTPSAGKKKESKTKKDAKKDAKKGTKKDTKKNAKKDSKKKSMKNKSTAKKKKEKKGVSFTEDTKKTEEPTEKKEESTVVAKLGSKKKKSTKVASLGNLGAITDTEDSTKAPLKSARAVRAERRRKSRLIL